MKKRNSEREDPQTCSTSRIFFKKKKKKNRVGNRKIFRDSNLNLKITKLGAASLQATHKSPVSKLNTGKHHVTPPYLSLFALLSLSARYG